MQRQDGFALIVVLWVAVFVTVIAFEFAANMKLEARIVRNFVDERRSYYLARSGYELAKVEIQRRLDYVRRNRGKSLSELQQETRDLWFFDGTGNTVSVGSDRIEVWIVPETGKIDLNKSDAKILRGFLETLDLEPQESSIIVDSLEDWKDGDEFHRLHGAESDYYQKLDPPYKSRNAPLESVEEWLMVRGMSQELLYRTLSDVRQAEGWSAEEGNRQSETRPLRVADCFTVNNTGGRINLNFAPEPVLRAIPFLGPGLVRRIMELRTSRGSEFVTADEFRIVLGDDIYNAVQPYVTIDQNLSTFTLRSRGETEGGVFQEIQVLVQVGGRRQQDLFHIIRWLDATY